jgi:hypothetical protein
MHKPRPAPIASTAGEPGGPAALDGAADPAVTPGDKTMQPAHPATVRYVGFRSTARGREYTLRVSDMQSSREFVLLITHQAFASREARFQDAPDVCSAKLRRELAADPSLQSSGCIAVTARDLLDYRDAHVSSSGGRVRKP